MMQAEPRAQARGCLREWYTVATKPRPSRFGLASLAIRQGLEAPGSKDSPHELARKPF